MSSGTNPAQNEDEQNEWTPFFSQHSEWSLPSTKRHHKSQLPSYKAEKLFLQAYTGTSIDNLIL